MDTFQRFCKRHLISHLTDRREFGSDPATAFQKCFNDMHKEFGSHRTRSAGVDPDVSGTTAIAALVHGTTMHVANVGDSRAILLQEPDDGSDGPLKVVPLSDDHKPNRADESERILSSEASVYSEAELREGGNPDKQYVCRENRTGVVVYGVLFTRSIGDVDAHKHLGIVADAEMVTHELTPKDKYIILATDGVWDVMSNELVGVLAAKHEDAQECAAAITKEARKRWLAAYKNRTDDITVVVMVPEFARSAVAGGAGGATAAVAAAEPASAGEPAPAAEPASAGDAGDAGATDGAAGDGDAAVDEAAVEVDVEATEAGADAAATAEDDARTGDDA